MAKASVVTARKKPRRRKAGRPTIMATTGPDDPGDEHGQGSESRCQVWVA